MTPRFASPLILIGSLGLISAPACAELPEPVRAMVDAAIATGDKQKVQTVIDLAEQTNPADKEELERIHDGFKADQERIASEKEKERVAAIRAAGVFDHWSGNGEIGAFRSSGNSSETGITVGLKLKREGIDWSHEFRITADYRRTNGTTTREQILAAYEPRYQIDDGLFTYGLAQYERDRFQGFNARYAVSGGLGYKLADSKRLNISVKAGPAFRRTEFVDGTGESKLAGLIGLDFDWQISDGIKLTQDTNMVAEAGGQAQAIFDSTTTSLLLVTGLEAKISKHLSTRMSFTVDYDSNPPDGSVSTDTLSRFTLLYGF